MTVRTVAGSFETARKLVENGLTEYLQKIVPADTAYLAPLFEHDPSVPLGLDDRGNGNGWNVEFENTPLDPALVTAQEKLRPWFSVMVSDNFTQKRGLGLFGYARSYLVGIVDIFVRAGTGTSRARAIADELADWYWNLNSETAGVDLGLTRDEWQTIMIRQPELRNMDAKEPEKWFRTRLQFEVEVNRFFEDVN